MKGNLIRSINASNLSSGIISGLLGCTGGALLVLDAAAKGNVPTEQLVSWLFAVYVFGGLFSIVFPLVYKMPITGAHSISTAIFLGAAMPLFGFSEFVGAYIMSGFLIFLLGVSGIFNKILTWIPKEIIAAMLAGMIMNFMIQMIEAIHNLPWVGALAIAGFILTPRLFPKIPSVIGALALSGISLFILHPVSFGQMEIQFIAPQLQNPIFSLNIFLSLSLPIALLILSNDGAQGIGALKSFGYNPPVSKIISFSGLATMLTGIFGGHCANIGGMMTAVCSSEEGGPKEKRYIASIISGIGLLLFGLFSWVTIGIVKLLPVEFLSIVAGLALTGVLLSSLQTSFSSSAYRFSTLFAFVIALANISFFNISAPVWSLLVGGVFVKLMREGEPMKEVQKTVQSRYKEEVKVSV